VRVSSGRWLTAWQYVQEHPNSDLRPVLSLEKDFKQALENFQASLEVAKSINDREILIHVGEGIGTIYKEQGKYAEAMKSLDESLLLARAIEDQTRIAELLWRKAEVYYANGDFIASVSSTTEAAKIADQLGRTLQTARVLARQFFHLGTSRAI